MFFRPPVLLLTLATPVLLWLSLPGGGELWPLLFLALVPFLLSVADRTVSMKQVRRYGFVCGFLHFILLLYWIIIVLGRYGGLHWSIAVGALVLFASYMALYFVLFAVSARIVMTAFSPLVALWFLPTLWVGFDWLKGVAFTGIPWMDLGYGLWSAPLFIQSADIFGHHGITWLILFINCLVALPAAGRCRPIDFRSILVSGLLVVLVASGYSFFRRVAVEDSLAVESSSIRTGIVQGNIDQSMKWSTTARIATIDKYTELSRTLLRTSQPELLVWPETALPFYPVSGKYMGALKELTSGGAALLTGAPWYEIVDYGRKKIHYFNSALLLDDRGKISGKYYKSHLVPFGEYVPLKKFLPFLAPLVENTGDFSAGKIERPLAWKQGRIGVLICFESVFPELTRKWVMAGANMLVNLTNDAWYGKSSAPHQSLAMAVLRAVESRRSVVRAANTGISAFISPLGEVAGESGLFRPYGHVDDVQLREEKTFWARYGYLFGPFCLVAGCLAVLSGKTRLRKR
ncbi:apolipoprotein N-acyltransferase [Desulfomarina sp.]